MVWGKVPLSVLVYIVRGNSKQPCAVLINASDNVPRRYPWENPKASSQHVPKGKERGRRNVYTALGLSSTSRP